MADDQITEFPPTIELLEKDGVEDALRADERGGHFNFSCDEPWAGDTQTGFGRETSIALDAGQARQLADWIYGRLAMMEQAHA